MSSTINPDDKCMTAHILQGVGTWEEGRGRAIGSADLETRKSEGLQHTISSGLAVENYWTGQRTHTIGKSDTSATDVVWPSRDSDRGQMNVRRRASNTPVDGSMSMGISIPANAQLAQFHRYLSAPAKCDPWHGMRYAPSRHTQIITNVEPRASGSSIPSSLSAEYGNSVTNQKG